MNTFSLYNTASGAFTGARIVCDDAVLAINPAPAGFAWMPGAHNPLTAKVVLITDDHGAQVPGVAVQTPAQPAETDWFSWAWDATAEAWREVPKLKLKQENARLPVLDQLAELDKLVARPAGEITQALALGQTPPAAAVQRLQAINADKQGLRGRLAAIAACADEVALQALLATPLPLQTTLP